MFGSPVHCASGCRHSGLMVKSKKVVSREKEMKATATRMVGMLKEISGTSHGLHGRALPSHRVDEKFKYLQARSVSESVPGRELSALRTALPYRREEDGDDRCYQHAQNLEGPDDLDIPGPDHLHNISCVDDGPNRH
eukprot:3938934-Rhodomonas_salina.1